MSRGLQNLAERIGSVQEVCEKLTGRDGSGRVESGESTRPVTSHAIYNSHPSHVRHIPLTIPTPHKHQFTSPAPHVCGESRLQPSFFTCSLHHFYKPYASHSVTTPTSNIYAICPEQITRQRQIDKDLKQTATEIKAAQADKQVCSTRSGENKVR